jgi:hypothetical protein
MTYVINNYNGSLLVSVPDRSINTTATSIKLPARDYPRYGEPMVENLVWMLQNFANTTPPLNPINGQIWYDTVSKSLLVYDKPGASPGSWRGTGKTVYGVTLPTSPENGQLFYDSSKKQLFVWDTSSWRLIAPLGTANNVDPANPLAISFTNVEAVRVSTGASTFESILKITVAGTVMAIFSPVSFTALANIPGTSLNTVSAGITLVSSGNFVGNASSATLAVDSTNLGGQTAATYYRKDETNIPTTNNLFDLGSSAIKYATVYATTFDGTSLQARYADLAERYASDESLEPGTVVQLGGAAEVTQTTTMGSDQVFGVVSTAPAVKMNNDAGDDVSHPFIALVGRVPVKVKGTVMKGQRLMSSDVPGVACAWNPLMGVLAIIGRSLETKTTTQVELVEAVVGAR